MTTTLQLSPHEIQGLCQRYLSDDVTSTTENGRSSTPARSFQVKDYKLKPTSNAPAGFLGRHQYLNVEITFKDDEGREQPQKLRFFSKSAPIEVASQMQYLEDFGVFKKEIIVYREVLPRLQEIFAGVAPKCYYADNNLLVFENLSDQGYRMGAGRDGLLNYEHLSCSVRTLAALHAGSIVFELRHGRKINELLPEAVVENAYPIGISNDHVRYKNFSNANKVYREIIKILPKYQKNLAFVLEEFPRKMQLIFQLVKTSSKHFNVFSHGDIWANNMMFQYGKFGETPIQCRFVDFQLARYAPPMVDLITMLTIPTSCQFREQYLSELLCSYYRSLSEFLKRENLSVEYFMPKKQFFESIEEFRIVGLIESCLFSHLTILPPELTQSLTGSAEGFSDFFENKRVEMCMEAFRTDKMYRDRMTDMLEDLIDNFVLKSNE